MDPSIIVAITDPDDRLLLADNVVVQIQKFNGNPIGAQLPTIVELKVQHPGSYLLVDHALSRTGKGAVGVLEVTGEGVPGVYKPSAL